MQRAGLDFGMAYLPLVMNHLIPDVTGKGAWGWWPGAPGESGKSWTGPHHMCSLASSFLSAPPTRVP